MDFYVLLYLKKICLLQKSTLSHYIDILNSEQTLLIYIDSETMLFFFVFHHVLDPYRIVQSSTSIYFLTVVQNGSG